MKRGSDYIKIYLFIALAFVMFFGFIFGMFYFFSDSCGELKGDANGDGKIDNFDVKKIKDFSEKKEVECLENADYNSDGLIDVLDGRELTNFLLDRGKIDYGTDNRGILSPDRRPDLGKKPNERISKYKETDEQEDESCESYVGDINGDGFIDKSDFEDILNLLTRKSDVKCEVNADVNNDGVIDIDDKNELKDYLFGSKIGEKSDLCINGGSGFVVGYKDLEVFRKEDSCVDENVLVEYSCEDTESKEKRQVCNDICEDGKCSDLIDDGKKSEDLCVDIDGGSNIAQQGDVSLSKNGEISSFKDSCEGNIVLEYSCKGNDLVEERINCANGCIDGECIDDQISCALNPKNVNNPCDVGLACGSGIACDCDEECSNGLVCTGGICKAFIGRSETEDFCYDSDGGSDYTKKGIVSGVKDGLEYGKTDYCRSSIDVIEYVCQGDYYKETGHLCLLGEVCSDGKCGVDAAQQTACSSNSPDTCDILSCAEGQTCQCDAECDIGKGLKCINNACALPPSCTSNSQCGNGLQCKNNVCVSASCVSNSQCAVGLECIQGQCKIPPTIPSISCENNPAPICNTALDCQGRCDCYAECNSGYCWGSAPLTYTCQNSCAPAGSYVHSPFNCCSGTWYNGQCIAQNIPPISCFNNPSISCDVILSCAEGQTCECDAECSTGLNCVNGQCSTVFVDENTINTLDPGSEAILDTGAIGVSCTSNSQCTSGYCWGNSAGSYTCQTSCAPAGSYVPGPLNCCSGTWSNGQCIAQSIPISCGPLNNPSGCNSELNCPSSSSSNCDCNEECESNLCVDGKCD